MKILIITVVSLLTVGALYLAAWFVGYCARNDKVWGVVLFIMIMEWVFFILLFFLVFGFLNSIIG